MKIEEIDKWLDNEYGCSYTKLEELHNYWFEKSTDQKLEIERLNKERKAIKKYVHNHTITYIENGIECCKPDEYFNIYWVENMLDGNFENLEILFEGSDKE